jgi:hypothetical protein
MGKRLAAVVLALSLLRVNALRADVACARHDVANAPVAAHDTASEHRHHGSYATQEPSPDQECETPVQAECCQALASCSVFLDLGGTALDQGDQVAEAVPVKLTEMPRSRVAAPEPPPPRA